MKSGRKDSISPSQYVVIANISNDTPVEMRMYLEMLGKEVILSSGHSVELLAQPSNHLLPITVRFVQGGLQIHPHKEFDLDWHVRFKGKLIRAGHPTVLAEHE